MVGSTAGGRRRARAILVVTAVVAFVTFCVVQDRVTAAGARRYVRLQREALANGGPQVTIDEIMRPAIDRSVRQGLAWAGMVAGVGVAAALAVQRKRPDREER
jgi:hypothetical protein